MVIPALLRKVTILPIPALLRKVTILPDSCTLGPVQNMRRLGLNPDRTGPKVAKVVFLVIPAKVVILVIPAKGDKVVILASLVYCPTLPWCTALPCTLSWYTPLPYTAVSVHHQHRHVRARTCHPGSDTRSRAWSSWPANIVAQNESESIP